MKSFPMAFMLVLLIISIVFANVMRVDARECQVEDFIGSYTPCVDGRRNLVYYLREGADCTDITCPSGQYLPFGSTSPTACTPCAPGQFSLGGGVHIEGSAWVNTSRGWAALSNEQINFRTSCTNTRTGNTPPLRECSGWQIIEGMLGYSAKTSDNDVSTLEASANFVRDGTITFEYRVEAERGFDYLNFEMDDQPLLSRISQQLTWQRISFNVSAGTHVFRWKYIKDFSISYGDDAAALRMIEVTGTAYADSSCTRCPAGKFAQHSGSQTCTACPANTIAPNSGSSSCTACGTNQYSFPGSSFCNNSLPCTQNDMLQYYSSCFANNTRSQYNLWQSPKICSSTLGGSVQLPADRYNLPCAPCSPGFERGNAGTCVSCPTNYFSTQGNPCQPCASGHVGRRDFIWTNFEELPPSSVPAQTGCSPAISCGTPGWRLFANYIDSGIGHSAYADSSFSLNLTTLSPGTVVFNTSFVCNSVCYLTYQDYDITGSNASRPVIIHSSTYYSVFYGTGIYAFTMQTTPGDHMFSFHFSKFDTAANSRDDRVRIWGLSIQNVASDQGGAGSCQGCKAGTYATSSAAYCVKTPPGTYSGDLATAPIQCQANTFAERPGSTECLPCGVGTSSAPGSSWCGEDCKWVMNSDITYDLSPLERIGGDMYGPISEQDSPRRTFYLNVCTRQHTNNSCVNDDNEPILTPSCMVDPWGYGQDLGRVINWHQHPSLPNYGVSLVYTNSTFDKDLPCYEWVGNVLYTKPRVTNITFNCDPMAGYGMPLVDEANTGTCNYAFTWNSLFACPSCDESDWSYYYTECYNGVQYKTFQWKDNPRKCHGGLNLPAPIPRNCSLVDQTPCPAGQYLLDSCVDCDIGTFSLGGAKIFNDWSYGAALPPEFSARGNVIAQGSYVQLSLSQGNVPSWETQALILTLNFVRPGSIKFDFTALIPTGYNMLVSYDGLYQTVVSQTKGTWEFEFEVGTHQFVWNLTKTRDAAVGTTGGFRLYRVIADGTSFAAPRCLPSLPGTYVASPSLLPFDCPMNTFQPEAQKIQCQNVPQGKWAPVGSERYYDMQPCTMSDFDMQPAGQCNGRDMLVNLIDRLPKTCVGGVSAGQQRIPCSCPPGQRPVGGVCTGCQEGQVFDGTSCSAPSAGTAIDRVISMVKGRTVLPPPDPNIISKKEDSSEDHAEKDKKDQTIQEELIWATKCQGTCARAWSLVPSTASGPILDSGLQVGASISTMVLIARTTASGNPVFTLSYSRSKGSGTSFYVIINNDIVLTDSRISSTNSFSYELEPDYPNVIVLVLIAGDEIIANSVMQITDLKVTGAMTGFPTLKVCPAGTYSSGGSPCLQCSPGTFTSTSGASVCNSCPLDTFAAFYGSTSCTRCGEGSSTTSLGASLCKGTCAFADPVTGNSYDLNSGQVVSLPIDNGVDFFAATINLCDAVDNEFVDGSSGFVQSTYYYENFGTLFSRQNPGPSGPIIMRYTQGSACTPSTNRSTTVSLYCPDDTHRGSSAPTVLNHDDCTINMQWYTSMACKACSVDDFEPHKGACIGRVRTIYYLPKSDRCSSSSHPPPKTEPCNELSLSIGFIIAAVVIVAFGIAGVIIFCLRYRKVSVEYQLLKDAQNDNFAAEDNQFGVDDEEEGVTLDQLDDDGLRLPPNAPADNPHEDL